mmetsp:Transcript_31567/g.92549  ORF Transcript_31567/g.92549 Transcript_31567/m.92549 type:complete len:202 (-) Transcript_31567:86-691(-)
MRFDRHRIRHRRRTGPAGTVPQAGLGHRPGRCRPGRTAERRVLDREHSVGGNDEGQDGLEADRSQGCTQGGEAGGTGKRVAERQGVAITGGGGCRQAPKAKGQSCPCRARTGGFLCRSAALCRRQRSILAGGGIGDGNGPLLPPGRCLSLVGNDEQRSVSRCPADTGAAAAPAPAAAAAVAATATLRQCFDRLCCWPWWRW